jgi:hypothetical protein
LTLEGEGLAVYDDHILEAAAFEDPQVFEVGFPVSDDAFALIEGKLNKAVLRVDLLQDLRRLSARRG